MKMRSAILCLGLLALVGAACAASLDATQVVKEEEISLELDHAGVSFSFVTRRFPYASFCIMLVLEVRFGCNSVVTLLLPACPEHQ